MSLTAILIIFALLISMGGCSKIEANNEMSENMLKALNTENYSDFSKDFDDALKNELDEENFAVLTQQVKGAIGNYKDGTLSLKSYSYNNGVSTVIYIADFENKSAQQVRIIFKKIDDVDKIIGLWFD